MHKCFVHCLDMGISRGKKGPKRSDEDRVSNQNDSNQLGDQEWLISVYDELKAVPLIVLSSGKSCIYRIPKTMRDLDRKAYDPMLVSIGPLRYEQKRLESMNHHKWRFLRGLLFENHPSNSLYPNATHQNFNREPATQNNNTSMESPTEPIHPNEPTTQQHNVSLETLVDAMKALEKQTRECYHGEDLEYIDSNNFCLWMILDGYFILQLLREYYKESYEDPILATRWMLPILQRDLLMLENQLPFIVLKKLFQLTTNSFEKTSLIELALNFFDDLLPREPRVLKKKTQQLNAAEHLHLLDLFRSSLLPSSKKQYRTFIVTNPTLLREKKHEKQLINCVTELREGGIKFKKGSDDADLLDIKFNDGVLEIPPLIIDDCTGPLFLNLMAFEQCHPLYSLDITTYVLFFDSLVNSGKDVDLLHYDGIIQHSLGSVGEVADLINKLCIGVVFDSNCYLSEQLNSVNAYCGRRWHLWRAKLIHDYFSSPWTFLSLLAAIALLLFTFVQTIFTVYDHFHK